jgi:hypothetical protein
LTVADTAKQPGDGDSGHSQVAISARQEIAAERLRPKTAYSHCRPLCIELNESTKLSVTAERDHFRQPMARLGKEQTSAKAQPERLRRGQL